MGSPGLQARRAAQVRIELGVVVDTGHERQRHLVGRIRRGQCRAPHDETRRAQITFGVGGPHAQQFEQRRAGHHDGRGPVVFDATDGVRRVAGVEEHLHDARRGEEPDVGRIEEGAGDVGEQTTQDPRHEPVMLQVGDRAHHRPRLRQQPALAQERGQGVDEAGKDVCVHDAVHRARRERGEGALEVGLVIAVEVVEPRSGPGRATRGGARRDVGEVRAVYDRRGLTLLQAAGDPPGAGSALQDGPRRHRDRIGQGRVGRGGLDSPLALLWHVAEATARPLHHRPIAWAPSARNHRDDEDGVEERSS